MRLLRLHIENFGTLQGYKLELSEGLNVLHEKNGWGKSTLAVFIKAMLYGLPATTKRSLEENERKKYAPWQGGVYGGSLDFECQKGQFRVERAFADKESGDHFALYDLSTNKPSDAFTSALGEELFGIDADGFERSTYLSQRANYGRSESISIQTKLGDLLDDVNDMGNYDTAVETLEKRRKFYQLTGNRGAIAEEEKKCFALRAELEACAQTEALAEEKRAQRKTSAEQLDAALEEEKDLQKKREAVVRARERAVQMEEKSRRLGELSELEGEKKRLEEVFCGFVPSEAELNAARLNLDSLRDSAAALRAIPEVSPDAEELESLGALFGKEMPHMEDLDAQIAGADKLRRMREAQKRLNDELAAIHTDLRFSSGVPTPEAFESAFASLSNMKAIEEEIDRFEHKTAQAQIETKKKSDKRLGICSVLSVLGAIALVISFLLDGILRTGLLIAGGVLAVVGGILVAILASKAKKQKTRAIGAAEKALQEKTAAYKREQEALDHFFLQCQTANVHGMDLYRLLTELSVAAVQARENVHRRRALREKLGEVCRAAEQLRARVAAYVGRYDKDVEEAAFAQMLTSLRRDAERYVLLLREEDRRILQRRRITERQNAIKADLTPFLKRYDKTGARDAVEVVSSISEAYTAYRALCDEYRKKDVALREFVKEKQLDQPLSEEATVSPEALAEEERALQRRMTELRELQTRLGMEIERLSEQTDRIPELESALKSSEERLAEYTKNFKTVTTAQKMLAEAKEALSTRYLAGMQESFLRYLDMMTDGEVPESVLDSSFDVRTRDAGQSRTMESYSRGSQDAVRFCVRLSLTEALYADGERPFLLLDDPFVNLDEDRLAAVQGLLEALAQQYQIVHMVCHEGRI